ncbi:phosphomannomutase [Marinobacter psychrophilus]|jgi:phosphomannomutase/phosphoglucomutase|uniref:phosphomannomutase n=1 Tax=Marinobacter psychrophilus TaxID=330734 RepID=A0A0H4I808_9GAMM|nr:phosphomannomutase/phosphoglucomutase [Marinobacter psychrophilus]AKO53865.1 phosphomannomutase [Marinobacter psychrophilus]
MKLGKKKTPESQASDHSEGAKPLMRAIKRSAKSDQDAGSANRMRTLSVVALSQALIVVVATALTLVLVFLLILQPASEQQFEVTAQTTANNAASRINGYLSLLQQSVEGLATQPSLVDTVSSGGDLLQAAKQLKDSLPGLAAVYLFPHRAIPRSVTNDPLLGFAGLELARKAETRRPLFPDAFPRDNRWFIHMAAPVKMSGDNPVAGTLLMVFDAISLQPLLADGQNNGALALRQSVSGTVSILLSQGSGSGEPRVVTLKNPDWSIAYTPAGQAQIPVKTLLAALLMGLPLLAAAIAVWVLLNRAQRSLRRDSTLVIEWAHKAYSGERSKLPALQWDSVASLAEVLYRLSQVVERRVSKAGEGAVQAAAGKKRPTAEAGPLFKDKDLPDVDMLEGDEDVLGFGSVSAEPLFGAGALPEVEELGQTPALSADIFRAYDIRGIVDETLTEAGVELIGQAIGSEALARGVSALCVGYDGRHSSPGLADAVARGLMASGCDVIHVGAVPTPVLYFATHQLDTGSGVMVTGSHNPSNYNGLKIMLGGETLSGDAIKALHRRILDGNLAQGSGSQSSEDVRRAYLDAIVSDIAVAAPLKVVVDAGNGIAGELGTMLIDELGCDVIPLYCDVDGDFPNHHPDPGKPENLQDLISKVEQKSADLGIAFDGDGDRIGVVTNRGRIIWPDRLLMLFARDVVSRNPGADVLYDVKCSRRLAGVISQAGGRPVMWKTGHSLMKAKMRETGALLAGEMSGHIFFAERWYGFDDGLYAAARLLEILGIEDRQSDEVFEDFPEDISTPELNIEVTEASKFGIVERLSAQGEFDDGSISTIDGVRVEYGDGWGLCRASNTTPALVLRFEAESEEALARIKTVFREQLLQVAPELNVTF